MPFLQGPTVLLPWEKMLRVTVAFSGPSQGCREEPGFGPCRTPLLSESYSLRTCKRAYAQQELSFLVPSPEAHGADVFPSRRASEAEISRGQGMRLQPHPHAPAEPVEGWRLCESGCSSAGTWRLPSRRLRLLCPSSGRIRSPLLAPVMARARRVPVKQALPNPRQAPWHCAACRELGPPSSAAPGGRGLVGRLMGRLEKHLLCPPIAAPGSPPAPDTGGAHG